MDDMPRPRPPHLHRQVTQHGKTVWYVRIGKGPRVRIRAAFGTAEFDAEYQAALAGLPARQPEKDCNSTGTLAWLVERYRETGAWRSLSLATRRQRENIFRHVLEKAGRQPVTKITKATIIAGRDRRATTPSQARHFLDATRGLFRWAVSAGMVRVDPTAGVDDPARPKSDGFPPWSEEDVAAYEARWPIGTRERVWLDVIAYTGLRRGDAVRFGRQHVRDGIGRIKTAKTGMEVTLPILPVLAETLAAGPCGDLTFITGKRGNPLTKEAFGNLFRKACNAAGINDRSAHGLRKIAATRAADRGATEAQLEAIFGWTGGRMASLYTIVADWQWRRCISLRTIDEQSIPSPSGGVREWELKYQQKQCDNFLVVGEVGLEPTKA
jgi:integrase